MTRQSIAAAPWLARITTSTVVTLFFAVLLFYPVGYMLAGAFVIDGRLTLRAFDLLFRDALLVESIRNSLGIAAAVTVTTTLIAFPLAHLFVHYDFRGKALVQGALLSAVVLPPFVASIGIKQLFGRLGSVNLLLLDLGIVDQPIDFIGAHPLLGVFLLETLHLYPILFLNVVAALANVDPALDEAAESVGASRFTRFTRVTVPLVLPGYFAGAILVFIFAFTDLGTPLVFDTRNLVPFQIFSKAETVSRDPVGYALVVLVLVLSLVLFLLGRWFVARRAATQAVKGASASRVRRLAPRARVPVALALVALLMCTLLPHIAIALVAFSDRWFFTVLPEEFTLRYMARVMSDPVAYDGVKNSLIYASLSTLIDLVIGVAIAWLAVRRRARIGRIADACAMLPLALPGIVLAFGYAVVFDLRLDSNPFWLIVLGYSMRRLPYVVRAADAGFRQVPVALEEAAHSLGASGFTTLKRITVPLLLGNLVAGGMLAFSFAMLEVSESLILAPKQEHFPIAKAIYQLLGDVADGPQVASAMGVIGTCLLLYSLIAASRVLGKSLGELFRA